MKPYFCSCPLPLSSNLTSLYNYVTLNVGILLLTMLVFLMNMCKHNFKLLVLKNEKIGYVLKCEVILH